MADELNKTITEVTDKVVKVVHESRTRVLNRLDVEQKKAQIRSEIGHNQRDLTKAYEKLGREYYAAKESGIDMADMSATLEMIRSKEKVVELLNEKLSSM